jgi:hypothetical protein
VAPGLWLFLQIVLQAVQAKIHPFDFGTDVPKAQIDDDHENRQGKAANQKDYPDKNEKAFHRSPPWQCDFTETIDGVAKPRRI